MQYKIEKIREINDSIMRDWQTLWKHAENANIFNSYEWFRTCIEAKRVTSYELLLCYQDNKLVALLPLETYRCFGIQVKGSLCPEFLADTPFLLERYDKVLLKTLLAPLFNEKNVYLQKVDRRAAFLVKSLYPEAFFSLISVNPTLTIAKDPFKNASQSTKERLQRVIRKNPGKFRYETYSKELEKHLETMFALQENSSKKARSLDIFSEEKTKIFYRILTKYCKDFVRINILYYENSPIAYEYGFLYKNTYLGAQISYHNEFKRFVPGKLIIYYLIENLGSTTAKILDQGGGISSYKTSFANDYRVLYTIYFSGNTVILIWWKIINTIRRIKQLLFPKKYTRDHEFLFKTLQ